MSSGDSSRFKVYHNYLQKSLQTKKELIKDRSNLTIKTTSFGNPTKRPHAEIVVVIPVWGRHKVLAKVFASLRKQTHPVRVLAIISSQKDRNFCRKQQVDTCHAPNHPLGTKFQTGITEAKKYNPKAVMILGSDDLLSLDYVAKAYKHIQKNVHMVGINKWVVYRPPKELYFASYKNLRPMRILGSGRLFSRFFLDRASWRIYDTSRNANLDIMAENIARNHHRKVLAMNEGTFVFSFKGNWNMLHSFEKMVKSTLHIQLIKIKDKNNKFLNKHLGDTWSNVKPKLPKPPADQSTVDFRTTEQKKIDGLLRLLGKQGITIQNHDGTSVDSLPSGSSEGKTE